MPKDKIFFRADGNSKIGLGHVIRSLALAEMLNEVFECHFIIRNPLADLEQQILKNCKSIISLSEPKNDLTEAKFLTEKYFTEKDIVVLDGYHFRTSYQKTIKDKACKLVCIDDIRAYHFVADLIINHAGGISAKDYSAETYTRFCLGLQYALLRSPFREAASNRKYLHRDKHIFICLGGADPNNDILEVLQLCEKTEGIQKCYVVIGAAYQHHYSLKNYLSTTSLEVKLLSQLSAQEMVSYMKKCSRAITPPSTISFEYLSVGGSLYLKMIADNQVAIKTYFIEEGLAFSIEDFIKTPKEEQVSIKKQASIFDGKMKERYLEVFEQLVNNE